jgi:hypothetical protein
LLRVVKLIILLVTHALALMIWRAMEVGAEAEAPIVGLAAHHRSAICKM